MKLGDRILLWSALIVNGLMLWGIYELIQKVK